MANKKLTDLTEDTAPTSDDIVLTTDIGTLASKKVTLANLGKGQTVSSIGDVTITTIASGELLKWNGTAWINNTLTEAGIIGNVVEDTTPQLGGDLDLNGSIMYDTPEFDNGNSGTADTIDFSAGHFQKSTLTGNVTYTFTAPTGPTRIQLRIIQDATGSRTVTWPAAVKWAGGTAPTLTTAASSVDMVTITYDGTNYYGSSSLDMK